MCRKGMSECDLDEYCSGKSGECPENMYRRDGMTCRGGQGYCYR